MSGKSLVKNYMTKNVISVKPDTPNMDVIKLMKKTGHDGFPVIDDDEQIVGIVTAFDLLLNNGKIWLKTSCQLKLWLLNKIYLLMMHQE